MNGGWKTEPNGGRGVPLMAVEREENGREGCACACGWREKKREERRGRERESGEHAAKRVIESRARSLLYRPPYAYPVPFPQHPTPYSPFLSLSPSPPFPPKPPDTAIFSYPIFLHPSSFSDDRHRPTPITEEQRKRKGRNRRPFIVRARKENFPSLGGRGEA